MLKNLSFYLIIKIIKKRADSNNFKNLLNCLRKYLQKKLENIYRIIYTFY